MNEKNIQTVELTEENIRKAYEVLGIEYPEMEKSVDIDIEKAVETEKKLAPEPEVEKESDTDEKDEKEKEEKEESPEDDEKEDDEKEDDEKEEMSKSVSSEEITQLLEKSISEKLKVLGQINLDISSKIEKSLKMMTEVETKLEKSIQSMNFQLEKSLEDVDNKIEKSVNSFENRIEKSINLQVERNDTLLKSIDEVSQRVKKIENTPNPRKSITNSYVQKSMEEDLSDGQEGMVLSISRDRKKISDMLLEKSNFQGTNPNSSYVNETITFESTGRLSKAIMDDLSKSHGIRFTS